ncbi:MAG: sigma-54 dependent transcriptional regulator [Proteobacteria bacterium]|nr:sigma-54 dependent transcriptional regulator [Pseudomonadota bacterium]MBU1387300.1 sigma-54 dependent transcriptional regulator [Pseudomonadota bacterium]MBU1544282.1 sigma-54 dependent transcriptional regulator [Pseudomonadota bacterium]MBU2482992.1 sigma-54 dependent transcriptional regulator [Pseudomonadota bacterium]
MTANILAVDDEKDMTRLLQRSLEPEIDCRVTVAFSGKMALDILEQGSFDLMICDIRMPEMDGFELLDKVKDIYPDLTVVMLTAFGNIESAVTAVKKGAYDFIPKPFDQDEIIFRIKKALERSELLKENQRLIRQGRDKDLALVGDSEPMQKVYDRIKLVAGSDITVLITGESGTGKDLTARSIHAMSDRKKYPYIPVNCPTIPEHILESELFGYKKGAFTNASRDKPGLFEEADKGTIFLDEIGDVGLSIQTKLLRVLQEKEIKPLGDNRVKKVDVRIIASTNRDLKQKMAHSQFREDFFYRLNVLSIELPALRERISDIPLIAQFLLDKHCKKLNKKNKHIDPALMDQFLKHSWPGNVRELENLLLQGILYSKGDIITPSDISIDRDNSAVPLTAVPDASQMTAMPYRAAKEKMLREFNHAYVGARLSVSHGNITQAARNSGLDRQSLQQIMKRFDIDPDTYRCQD